MKNKPTIAKQKKKTPTKTNNEKKIVQYIKIASFSFFFFLAFYLTVILNKDFLIKLDELSLFIPTKLFFINTMGTPDGLLLYLGTFLTQFFYNPWIGSLLLVSLLLLVQYLTVKAFNIPQKYYPLSFIPTAALLLSITELDYIIYTLKPTGYAYFHILGFIIVLSSLWLYKQLRTHTHRSIFSVLFIIAFYPLAGFYALFAAFLFSIHELLSFFKTDQNKYRFITTSVILISMVVVPLFYFYNVYSQIAFTNIYISGLPEFKFDSTEWIYWLPYVLGMVSLILIAIMPAKSDLVIKPKKAVSISFLVCLCSFFVVYLFSNKDEDFHTELAMEHAIFDNDWDKILRLNSDLKDEPTRAIVMSTNLALQKLNMAGDRMYTYKNGAKPYKTRKKILQINISGQPLFYQYGMTVDCYHRCMEDMVVYGMKLQNLRYMVKCSILNNEYLLAQKYNNVLKKTLFHKSWAKKYQKYIDNPNMVSSDPEFKSILLLEPTINKLDGDHSNLEGYLTNTIAAIDSGNFELLELSLQFNLQSKNIEGFWPRFFYYVHTHNSIPAHYQEAALLFSYLTKNVVDISKIEFDEQIVRKFREIHNIHAPEGEIKNAFAQQFGDTYWYYYYFLDFTIL
jgi:hypothetical protein